VNELIGTVIDGRFEVVRAIGKGGYGDVFEAIQLSVDRRVALKVVHRHLAERSDVSTRRTPSDLSIATSNRAISSSPQRRTAQDLS
jgi:serine/threonine protein kinase